MVCFSKDNKIVGVAKDRILLNKLLFSTTFLPLSDSKKLWNNTGNNFEAPLTIKKLLCFRTNHKRKSKKRANKVKF